MKKLFVLFAAATLFVGVQACKSTEQPAEEVTATEEVVEEAPAVVDSAAAVVDSAAAVVTETVAK